MRKNTANRNRLALLAGLLLAAGILLFRFWPRSVPLLNIARPLAWNATDIYDDSPRYSWLSNTDLLSFRHHPPNSPNTEPPAYASRWNLTTNTEAEIPTLTHAIQAEHGDGPFLHSISPDGRRVLWTNPVSATRHFYSAFADGHGLVNVWATLDKADAPGYEETMLWMGDGHTLLQVGIPYREGPLPHQPFGWLLDLNNPQQVQRIPAAQGDDFDPGEESIGLPDNRLLIVRVPATSEVNRFSTETCMEEWHIDRKVKRVQQWKVRLPDRAYNCESHFSPHARQIVWLLSTLHESYFHAFLHRLWSRFPTSALRVQEVWISDTDGNNMRYIGELPIKSTPEAGMGLMYDVEIEQMQWLPNGKQISFLYHNRLYLLNVLPSS